MISRICWSLVDIVSRVLEPDERDAVRGDFAESGESGGQALGGLSGLVARRQAALWKDWRPWLAPVGLIAPLAVFLSRPPVGETSLDWAGRQLDTLWMHGVFYETGLTVTDNVVRLVCACLLVNSWAWSAGFVLGSLSRRTAWVPVLIIFLGRFSRNRELFWLITEMVLILGPFLWGVHTGVRLRAIGFCRAVCVAAAIVGLTVIMQVEDGRESLAFAAWSSGGTLDGRLVWTPRLLPFAAILWQVGFMSAITRWPYWYDKATQDKRLSA